MKRTLALIVLAALAAIAAAGCSGDRDALTIYSGRGENLVGPLLERFSAETGIPIDVRYGDSSDIALLIAEEGESTPADVFYSQSPGAVGFLAGKGLLAELPGGLLDRVEPRFRSDSGLWVGITGRQRVLVFNSELVSEDELPDSVFDLTAERFAGEVALAPGNASFQDFVTAMRQLYGDGETREWLTAMGEGDPPLFPNNNAIVEAVGRGEVPMGLVNHYYNHRFLAEDPGLPSRNYVFPDGDVGALLLESGATILGPSDDGERAERLIRFLLSEEGQRYFADETFEYPLAAGVEPSADLPRLETLELPDYEAGDLGGGLERTAALIAEAGLGG